MSEKNASVSNKKFYQTESFRMFMGKYGIGVILVFMIIIIAILKPRFIYPSNILNVLTQISVNCLIAYGMCQLVRSLHWFPYYWDSSS